VARRPAGLNLVRKRRGEIRTSRQAPNTALQQFVPMPSLFRARSSMTQVSLVSLWARIIRVSNLPDELNGWNGLNVLNL
jgi:hypothetical protein